MSQSAARLFRLQRILKDISPTCSSLVEKAIRSVTSHATADDENMAEIILDGSPFKVGRNLENALRALRELPDVRTGLLVWADALYIYTSRHRASCRQFWRVLLFLFVKL
jgi:hypothetical protein